MRRISFCAAFSFVLSNSCGRDRIGRRRRVHLVVHRLPQAADEAERTLHALFRPLERLLGRRREHHEHARRVGAERARRVPVGSTPLFLDFDMVPRPSDSHRLVVGEQDGARALVHLHREPLRRRQGCSNRDARRRLAVIDVMQHHALRQQVLERLVDCHAARGRASPWSRSASTAGAGWRARCRRCTGPPASSS